MGVARQLHCLVADLTCFPCTGTGNYIGCFEEGRRSGGAAVQRLMRRLGTVMCGNLDLSRRCM